MGSTAPKSKMRTGTVPVRVVFFSPIYNPVPDMFIVVHKFVIQIANLSFSKGNMLKFNFVTKKRAGVEPKF